MDTSIIIRTLNEKKCLAELLAVLRRQDYSGETEIIVVDNQSTDGTAEFAVQQGAKLVTIKKDDFSYPFSMNKGAEVASGEILVYLVGHALPFKNYWLRHGLEHFADPQVAGVYSPVIPKKGCTFAEMLFYWPGYLHAWMRGPHCVKQGAMGVFGATNIALRKNLWEKHHFDERYGLGGEDGEWAGWVMSQGLQIVCDYRFSVRHSHGLGFSGLKKQIQYWSKLGKPSVFSRGEFEFRKDLKF
ncbi:MAG: glycosyltransferase [Patescibacteria group bacterium]